MYYIFFPQMWIILIRMLFCTTLLLKTPPFSMVKFFQNAFYYSSFFSQ
ncbi:hypothetical protein BPO_1420 [Bergeyella porcorum]|uniref:ATP synthase F0 subunit 8 n=1 Tax=Bergeyella porcorum TaxID=1735111 RepID=A0AAU0F1K9_9FLAO